LPCAIISLNCKARRHQHRTRQLRLGAFLLLRSFSASPAACWAFGGSLADHFRGPDGGDEFFYTVTVEFDRGPLSI
jgi:hypothetical protein